MPSKDFPSENVYRHPLNFAVNVDIGDPANIKTAKILSSQRNKTLLIILWPWVKLAVKTWKFYKAYPEKSWSVIAETLSTKFLVASKTRTSFSSAPEANLWFGIIVKQFKSYPCTWGLATSCQIWSCFQAGYWYR